MTPITFHKKQSYPLKITTPNEVDNCALTSQSVLFEVNGQRINPIDCIINEIGSDCILTATITVPIVFGD
jgi:hypothetical protein